MLRLILTGQRFGRITVLKFHERIGQYRHWVCRCDCGAEGEYRGSSLTSGNTTQCQRCSELLRKGNDYAKKHGHSAQNGGRKPTPTYESWKAMKARCTRPTNVSWKWYGGRGIKVCERWHLFENFLADMGGTWPPGTTPEPHQHPR